MVVLLLDIFDYVIRLVLIMLLLKLLFSIGGTSTASIPVPTFGGAPPASADPMVDHVNQLKDLKLLAEARKYIADGHQAVLTQSVEDWYAAGCKNVWFELSRDINGHTSPGGVIVELPKDKTSRAKCYQILKDYLERAQISYGAQDLKDTGETYMTVPIR